MELEIGALLHGRYQITEILGKGGMGAVYKAEDQSLNVAVAVKENLIDDEEASQQFRREAEILARLRHPHMPRVTDHFVIAGQGQYLVMDFVEGEDLRHRLDRVGVLDEKEVIKMGATLCDALTYLHTQDPPILHRDIKPGNIKITPQGAVFLVDFGLVKIVQGTQQTATGARGLTPGYSPPEQYGFGDARTEARSDVYSLGATLYAALTGKQPEDGLSIMMGQTELTPVTERNKKISGKLADVIHQALQGQMADRYQSAVEFKEDLLSASDTVTRQLAEGNVTVAPAPASVTRSSFNKEPSEITERMKPFVLWTAVIVVSLLAIVGALAVFAPDWISQLVGGTSTPTTVIAQDTPTEAPAAVEDTETPIPEPTDTPVLTDTPVPTPEDTPTPAPTPMGGSTEIVFASMRAGRPQLFILNVVTREVVQLTEVDGGACQPSWAPDGMRLVFIAPCRANMDNYDSSSLFILNLEDGNIEVVPGSRTGDYDPVWSPDGNQIAFTSLRFGNRPNIHTYDFTTGFVTNISNSTVSDYHPAWSPDGEVLAFTTTGLGGSRIFIMDSQTGENRGAFSRSDADVNFEPFWSPDGVEIFFSQYSRGNTNQRLLRGAPWEDGGVSRGYNEFQVADLTVGILEPGFSPDGAWIIYVSTIDPGNFDLFLMRASGSGIRRMTTDPAIDFDPAWRPIITNP